MKNRAKIIVSRRIILLGVIFHSLIEMMSLFLGQNIAMPRITWMMLLFFIFPIVCITGDLHFYH